MRRALTSEGILVLAGAGSHRRLGPVGHMLGALVLSRLVGQQLSMFLATLRTEDLAVIAELIEGGKLTPVVDRTYPLREAPEAIRYLETGHARGKVVITV